MKFHNKILWILGKNITIFCIRYNKNRADNHVILQVISSIFLDLRKDNEPLLSKILC